MKPMTGLFSAGISRDGRDTLWLLAVLALCIAPHLPRLPPWCAAGALLALGWRAYMAWRDSPLPPRWVLLVALGVSIALTLSSYHSLFGREAGVTLVTVLTGLKTLELRARRDAFVVTSLGFFLILTQFLYSQSFGIALMMGGVLWGLLTSLVLAQRPLGRPSIWAAMQAAGRSVLMGLPVMLVLYVLFPRIGPLWALPSDAQARTGLSDQLTLGRVAELALDDSIAMRVRFEGAAPPSAKLYFRGPVLDLFDGTNWRPNPDGRAQTQADESDDIRPQGPSLSYQATIEPSQLSVLPLLEGTLTARATPPQTEPRLRLQGLQWWSAAPLTDRTQVDAQAWLTLRHGPRHPALVLRDWIQLPPGFNPRTLAWAQAFRSEPALREASPRALAQAVLSHIRQERFRYTLAPGGDGADEADQPRRDLIDQFWMDRRAGFCEHFATAFVVVMRAMNIPSRVVTGFQGAELNPIDGLYVVRNSHAHAWAEFWQPGEGWVRADPTAAVAPERIERSRTAASLRQALPGPLSGLDSPFFKRARAFMDAGNHRWNLWVLEYSRGRQLALLRQWGWESPDWTDLLRVCALLLTGLSLLGVTWLWWARPRQAASPWRRPLMRVHRALQRVGVPEPTDSPAPAAVLSWVKVLQRVNTPVDAQATVRTLIEALQHLDALRYAPPPAAGRAKGRADIRRRVKQIEQLAQQWRALRATTRDRAN